MNAAAEMCDPNYRSVLIEGIHKGNPQKVVPTIFRM